MQQLFCAYLMTLAICSTVVETSNDECSTSTMKLMLKKREVEKLVGEKTMNQQSYILIYYICQSKIRV